MRFLLVLTGLPLMASAASAQLRFDLPAPPNPNEILQSQPQASTARKLTGAIETSSYEASGVRHTVKIVYERSSCDVNWNEYCDDEWMIEAEEGLQVCKAVYSVTAHEGWDKEFKIQPASSYPYDPQEPDRFRAIVFKISARGTMKPWDQRGSKEVVENIGLDMIPAEADNYTRYLAGCWMP